MQDFILFHDEYVYKLSGKDKGVLTLSQAVNENIVKTVPVTRAACSLFSGDVDSTGTVHIAAVSVNALTYIKCAQDKVSTTHLMHLPEGFEITSLIISCEKVLRLNYCVKSKDGSALIEYTLSGDSWKGKNILTAPEKMTVLSARKYKNECYVMKKCDNSYVLINAYEPEKEVFSSFSPIKYFQNINDGYVFNAGDGIYVNGTETFKGNGAFVIDGKRILVRDKEIKEYIIDNGARFTCDVCGNSNLREYVYRRADSDMRIMLSTPYPYIKSELAPKENGGALREIYLQQRSIFQLQAEMRAIKARVKHLEEDRKRLMELLKQK